jgi:PIN domain
VLRLRPHADGESVLRLLAELKAELENARGGTVPVRYSDYMHWANRSILMLRSLISPADLESLILTRGYFALQQFLQTQWSQVELLSVVGNLVDLEIEDRLQAFTNAHHELQYWSGAFDSIGAIVLADSSLFIHHEQKLENWEFTADLHDTSSHDVCLVVPIAVVDELDRLKEHTVPHTRWRAAYSLALISKVVGEGATVGSMRPPSLSHGEVLIRILFDPEGHIRLPLADDEIVDRCVALEGVTKRKVTFLTCDTGQEFRAKAAGLETRKFDTAHERSVASGATPEPTRGS